MRCTLVPTARPAFTLLEMVLAAAIAVLLLGALYVAMDLQLRHAEVARDVVTQTTLARTLLDRIARDIAPSIGEPDPSRYQQTGQSGGSGGSGAASGSGGSTGGTTGAAGTTGSTASGSTGTSSTGATSSSTSSAVTNALSNGPTLLFLQGDSSSLTLFVSRVAAPSQTNTQNGTSQNATNTGANGQNNYDPTQPLVASDQRRIVYWLSGGGLAKQVIDQTTSDDADYGQMPADVSDPNSKLIVAKEVKSLQFQYFDGSDWQDSWDGTQLGTDGVTPLGPPLAVAITIGIASGGDDGEVKTYRHVVSILPANGGTMQSLTSTGATQVSTAQSQQSTSGSSNGP